MAPEPADPTIPTTTASPDARGAVVVREVRLPGPVPMYANPAWQARFPWLFQATTARGDQDPHDLSFFGNSTRPLILARWAAVLHATHFDTAVHARQVHSAVVLKHDAIEPGIHVLDDADGHVTQQAGVLLAVSIADCVPVFLVNAKTRTIALLHAGWRGAAAGILERGIEAIGGASADVHSHFGPAICGKCYEVGPEVFRAFGLPEPAENSPIDLRGVLRERAIVAGIPAGHVSISAWCTRCDDVFFSHRGGARERQMALLGIRPER